MKQAIENNPKETGPPSGDAWVASSNRAQLRLEVAKQRLRLAKDELKRARKRFKEARREVKRARKQVSATKKLSKRARRQQEQNLKLPDVKIATPAKIKKKPRGKNGRARSSAAKRRV